MESTGTTTAVAPSSSPSPVIKHIVTSGGGVAGFIFYGALKESNKQGMWDIDNIKTMHGTSIGSLMNTIVSLRYSWQDLDDYLIKRPWDQVFKINMYSLLEIFTRKGIFDKDVMKETMSPLLKGKDISVDVTMKEFYEHTGVEHHIYVTEINRFETVDISYKTHPDWKLTDAIYASCTLPILFPPICKDGGCFYDGGVLLDFPLEPCIEKCAEHEDEILSIMRVGNLEKKILTEDSTFFDYISGLVYSYIGKFSSKKVFENMKHTIAVENPPITIQNIMNTTTDINERIRLIEYGEKSVRDFLEKKSK
jgi:predicted acylesterase/phospholipase RssA